MKKKSEIDCVGRTTVYRSGQPEVWNWIPNIQFRSTEIYKYLVPRFFFITLIVYLFRLFSSI